MSPKYSKRSIGSLEGGTNLKFCRGRSSDLEPMIAADGPGSVREKRTAVMNAPLLAATTLNPKFVVHPAMMFRHASSTAKITLLWPIRGYYRL
jgi:hypothetical protein